MSQKRALLIAGGGTLGQYTAEELLKLGYQVDIICLEQCVSNRKELRFFQNDATLEFLKKFLEDKSYDGIVNFIHYRDVAEYMPVHRLLSAKTKHLIFLSSYRVYADVQSPITEEAPQLVDVVEDERFLHEEDYAVPKSKAERFIREESGTKNWTIVRPVISFSARRLDIVTVSGRTVPEETAAGRSILLPKVCQSLTAGVDWAGNSGKLIAHLLLKEKAYGEAFTVSTAQNLTWGEIADIYTDLIGAKFEWVDTETYRNADARLLENDWILRYDRLFERKIDNRKILHVTGLTEKDFVPIREGIRRELENIKAEKERV